MANQQYDVSHEMKRLFKIKQEQRKSIKEYFQKLVYNPHRPIRDGIPFDPVLQRFNSLSSYQIEHFKPTAKNALGAFCYVILPVIVFYKLALWEIQAKEKKISTGQVAYKDRNFKLYN